VHDKTVLGRKSAQQHENAPQQARAPLQVNVQREQTIAISPFLPALQLGSKPYSNKRKVLNCYALG
jgi:hypothetical protein